MMPDDLKIMSDEQKLRSVENWNNLPINKQNGIVAIINGKDYITIPETTLKHLKLFSYILVAALIVIIACGGIWGYFVYQDGTLLPKPDNINNNQVCGNMTIQPEAFVCNQTFVCNQSCICPTFPTTLNLTVGNLIVVNGS